MPLKSKNLSPSQVKLRPATIEDKAYLDDLAKTVYKKLIIDQFGRWDERQQHSNFEAKWKKATCHIREIAALSK